MRSTYLFLSVATPLALALVIPDESMLAEIVSQTRFAVKDQDSVTSPLDIFPDEHEGWRRDRDWPDDEYPRHGDWPGHGWRGRHGHRHDDYDYPPGHYPGPGYDEDPHREWPGYEDDHPRHGGWPGEDEGPGYGRRPGHGGWWPGHGDDEDRHCPPHSRHPRPGHGDDGEDRHCPPHSRHPQPGYGEWPGHRDDREDKPCPPFRGGPKHSRPVHRPIDACPGELCRTDKTTWQLIKESEHTSRVAEIIADDHDLVEILNSTEANHTFFVPTNHALERLTRGREDLTLTRKSISNLLRYHIMDDRFHIDHIASHQTLPTKLKESALGSKLPQRIVVREHHDGVVLNRRSLVVGADMKTKNGMIHIIDTVLHPPTETRTLLRQAPGQFSTFITALKRTNLASNLDPDQRQGGTTFVPTNEAFRRLGAHTNDFLFSSRGEKCLRALMQYHIVPNRTLYSDVFYTQNGKVQGLFSGRDRKHGYEGEPEVVFANMRLETLLKDRKLAVDLERSEEVVMRVNGFGRVGPMDLLASDGVVHVVDRVLIPPRKIQDEGHEDETWGELEVGELAKRLDDCVYGETTREL